MADDTHTVQRSTTIDAPPRRVFEAIADVHRRPVWSPWERVDPGMTRMGLFTSMDRFVGGDVEKGLAGLKSISENPA